ncbi:MAG: ribonuclease HII [Candidatus Omnitrophica bacterium]|nr:ribonuclease HII [Candidatus Omnitrophota bacterium]
MLYYEKKLKKQGYDCIIGVDEAGRGPLAGPVVAAAVALKTFRFKNKIDDSKKLSSCAREKAFQEIIGKAVFGVGIINEKVIDRVNILVATGLAMQKAISVLLKKVESAAPQRTHIIVDGIMKLEVDLPYTSIIRGDGKSKSIASASIIAKVIRDRIMERYDRRYPEYGFKRHCGYPTKSHREALRKSGPSPIHRKSFAGVAVVQ